MEVIVTVSEVILFIILCYAYYKICANREATTIGKLVEIIALYGVSVWSVLGNLKFIVWAALIGAIGIIKFITSKKAKIDERRNKGLVN